MQPLSEETVMMPFARPLAAVLTIAAMTSATPLWSRGGDNVLDEARLEKFAEKVNMLPFSQLPDPGKREITLEVNPDLDQKVTALGKACSGSFRPKTMVAPLVRIIAGYWDADGDLLKAAPGLPTATLRINSTTSSQRCVQLGEYEDTCFAKTRIEGEIETRDANGVVTTAPITSEVEREVPPGVFCIDLGDVYEGPQPEAIYALYNNGERASIALVNREAVIALINDAKRKIDGPVTARRQ
jgi:hypothetical protein